MEITSMFETWNVIMALLGGGFIGIYILGMFTRRASGPGVIIGALASVAATLWINEYTSVHWTFYSPVAVLTCIIVGYVASLIFRGQPKSQEGLTVFDMRRDLEG
jgi:SSS family solute:Na+ symporter